jgi:AcrR family transcriptional regulator
VSRRSSEAPAITKADVKDAALTLFAQLGYHGTSLKQVAGLLGLRTPSLYNHMQSKSSLLSDIVLDTLHAVSEDFERAVAAANGSVERLRCATLVYALRHATHPREALVVNRDSASLEEPDVDVARQLRAEHERKFRQIIIDGRKDGVFAVESPKLASFAILEMCVSIARWFSGSGEFTAEEVARHYGDYALRVVAATEQ